MQYSKSWRDHQKKSSWVTTALAAALVIAVVLLLSWASLRAIEFEVTRHGTEPNGGDLRGIQKQDRGSEWQEYGRAKVTGYNTIEAQTDDSPCYAGGTFICGRKDVVACPRKIAKGTRVKFEGLTGEYVCLDRTAPKHDGKFDISCDKDLRCPFRITGWRKVYLATK